MLFRRQQIVKHIAYHCSSCLKYYEPYANVVMIVENCLDGTKIRLHPPLITVWLRDTARQCRDCALPKAITEARKKLPSSPLFKGALL